MKNQKLTVLCIHGRPGNSTLMDPLSLWCGKHSYQFVSYDQFACRSDIEFNGNLAEVYNLLVAELRVVIEGVSCERLLVIAHSFGGALLCEVFAKLRALSPQIKVVFSGFCPEREEFLLVNLERLQQYTSQAGIESGETFFSDKHICNPMHLTAAQRIALTEKPFGDLIMRNSYSDLLELIECPVLFTYGGEDICTDYQASVVSRKLTNCRVLKFVRAAHYPFIEQPDCYFQGLDSFVAGSW